jgi:hypothetical protein
MLLYCSLDTTWNKRQSLSLTGIHKPATWLQLFDEHDFTSVCCYPQSTDVPFSFCDASLVLRDWEQPRRLGPRWAEQVSGFLKI